MQFILSNDKYIFFANKWVRAKDERNKLDGVKPIVVVVANSYCLVG